MNILKKIINWLLHKDLKDFIHDQELWNKEIETKINFIIYILEGKHEKDKNN